MTKEELLSAKTFSALFRASEFEQIEKENVLRLEAEKLGVQKLFDKAFKKYEKFFKNNKTEFGGKGLPKCSYNINNYNWGGYSVSIDGISDKSNVKFSYFPVIPVERYINKNTGKEKVKIIFYKEDKWHELTVDKSQLSINNKLLLLSDLGLDVNSENVKYYIKYFNEIMNINDVKKLSSVSHLGWDEDEFIPYDTHGIFDGADEFRNVYNAIGIKGNYDKWKEVIKETRAKKEIRILMGVVLSSPLIEKLNIQPFIANFWSGNSGNGKTLSCMLAMSIFGNPKEGALQFISNSTQNYYITMASFLKNITCYFDELQTIKENKYVSINDLIMNLCNGTEKGRLNKNSQAKEIKTWNCNFLFTNNDKLIKSNAGEQIYNRVIDIEINDILFDNPTKIGNTIRDNYGFFGKEYIKRIKNIGFENIKNLHYEIYDEILKKTNATSKQANSIAAILVAERIATDLLGFNEEYLTIDDVKDLIYDKNEIKTSIKAMRYIINVINANEKRFDIYNYGETWGDFKEDVNLYTFNYEILQRELKKGGFEFDTVKKEWAEFGFLVRNSAGRYTHRTSLKGKQGIYTKLKIKDEFLII